LNNLSKIVIAGACIFPGGAGGAVRCMHILAKGFSANGHHVKVVTTYGSNEVSREYELDGFVARSIGLLHDMAEVSFAGKFKSHAKFLAYLIHLTLRKRYDIILFYGPVSSFVCVGLFAKLMKRRVVYLMADIQPKTANMYLYKKLKRLISNVVDISLANLSDLVVVLGTIKLVKRYARLAPKSSRVQILAPVDTIKFGGGNGLRFKEQYGLKNKTIVTYSGTLDTLEGIDVILKAIKSVALKHSNVVLVIAGKTLDKDRVLGIKMDFKKLAHELDVSAYTVFTGHLPMQDIIDLLNASDVLVMPKIDHPLNHVASPIKIAEYLAAGRPIVSSRICDLDHYLRHMEHLVFCEPGNTAELSDAINLVLEEETLKTKLSCNALVIAQSLFDYRKIAEKIYENINRKVN